MAQIVWTPGAMATFSPEELDCAAVGGSWNRANSTCTVASPLPPAPPLYVAPGQVGTIDPDQMFADGFVYVNGQWVRWDSPAAIAAGHLSTGRPPGSASVAPVLVPGVGGLPGYGVPSAPGVLLPSFVGGNLGEVRDPGGMRPVSGGRPERVHMGPSDIPVVRMKQRWDLRS